MSDTAVWIRLPKPKARCAVTNLSRTSLSELCRTVDDTGTPVIKTVRLKKPGAKREMLLIDRQSLLDFLNAKASAQSTAAKLHLVPAANFNRFTELEIAENRDLWLWAVNPTQFFPAHEWFIGKLSSIDTRLNMMRRAGLTWSNDPKATVSSKLPSRANKRYERVIQNWSKLTDIQRLDYWPRVSKEVERRVVSEERLSTLSPALFVYYLKFLCMANLDRGADTPFPNLLNGPKGIRFAKAIRNDLAALGNNKGQQGALKRKLGRLERLAKLKEKAMPVREPNTRSAPVP